MSLTHGDSSEFFAKTNEIIENLNIQIKNLRAINDTMTTSGWKGNTSNTFNANIDSYQNQLAELSQSFQNVVNDIRAVDTAIDNSYADLSDARL